MIVPDDMNSIVLIPTIYPSFLSLPIERILLLLLAFDSALLLPSLEQGFHLHFNWLARSLDLVTLGLAVLCYYYCFLRHILLNRCGVYLESLLLSVLRSG